MSRLQVDEVPDQETRELVEMEIRELLNEFDYPGDSLPVSVYLCLLFPHYSAHAIY